MSNRLMDSSTYSSDACLSEVRFLNGGYCLQSARLAGAKSWRTRRFYAVFVAFQHPTEGLCLIDTGYGPAVRSATARFPERVLTWMIPVPKRQAFEQPNYPCSLHGFHPEDVRIIFLSHFHTDHIGGLSLFPKARLVYRGDCLTTLRSCSSLERLKHGFVQDLLPEDLQERSEVISESDFERSSGVLTEFSSLDFFGDQSLQLVDLPGHALGHTGYLMRTAVDEFLFYVVDAFWDRQAWETRRGLPWISRHVAHDNAAYWQTQEALRSIAMTRQLTPIACHCPTTQNYVT